MKKVLLTTVFSLAVIFTSFAQAQVIPLTVDSNQSSVDVSIGISQDSSSLSGDLTLDVQSTGPPSGSAQITTADLVLDDSLSLVPVFGVSSSTAPGDVVITLITPGAPGTIFGGSFNQFDNLLGVTGELNVSNLFGPDQTIDLSTIALGPEDFNSLNVTQSGNIITVSSSLTINDTVDLGPFSFPFVVDANFVATGVVPDLLLGDVNRDGVVDFSDIPAFIAVLQAGDFQAEADLDTSGMVDFDDIPLFITVLIAQ